MEIEWNLSKKMHRLNHVGAELRFVIQLKLLSLRCQAEAIDLKQFDLRSSSTSYPAQAIDPKIELKLAN